LSVADQVDECIAAKGRLSLPKGEGTVRVYQGNRQRWVQPLTLVLSPLAKGRAEKKATHEVRPVSLRLLKDHTAAAEYIISVVFFRRPGARINVHK
jgi:hypothetical protein